MISLFSSLSLAARLAIVGGVILALAGGYAAWRHDIFSQGRNYERGLTEQDNKERTDAADDAADLVRACDLAGGVWRSATGECEPR